MLLSVVMQKKLAIRLKVLSPVEMNKWGHDLKSYSHLCVGYKSSTLRFTNLANASPLSMLLAKSAKSIS